MRERRQALVLVPWLLCTCSLVLLGLTVVLAVLDRAPAATAQRTVASVIETVGFVGFPIVGAVIAARLPANPYGWVWCALGIAGAVLMLCGTVADASAVSSWWLIAVAHSAYVSLSALLVFVFLLFPTGGLPSRRWRWLARLTIVLGVALVAAAAFAPSPISPGTRPPWALGGAVERLLADLITGGTLGILLLVLVAIASVFSRFRGADRVERQQLKWFVLAAAVVAVYLAVELIGGPAAVPEAVWVVAGVVALNLIPVAVAIAVLRYRLYDIDRIISRSVSYGPLTGSSALAVAGSTLAVAAVFNPARRRLQTAVDRRFDRARYDAARSVDAFAARLRNEVDLDEIAVGLRDTVTTTVAPTRMGLWFKGPAGMRRV